MPVHDRGNELRCNQIDNDPRVPVREVRRAGRGMSATIEATHHWYWAVDALAAEGGDGHVAHPNGMTAMRKRMRVKTDATDSYEQANRLRVVSLPEASRPRGGCGRSASWSSTGSG